MLKHHSLETIGDEYEGSLFPLEELTDIQAVVNKHTESNNHRYRKEHNNNLNLCLSYSGSGPFQMPEIAPYAGTIPCRLIPFSTALKGTEFNVGVHFYIDDYRFERIWRSPERYVEILSKYKCVIGPDFSQYANMSYPMRMWNCYRNKVLSSYFQKNGVNIIPNATWSLPDSYDYSFSGIPRHSTIAINCTSIVHCNLSKFLWYKGYKEAISRLEPTTIIRYGSIMEDERKDISIYFENERLKTLRNGR